MLQEDEKKLFDTENELTVSNGCATLSSLELAQVGPHRVLRGVDFLKAKTVFI